LRSALIAFSRYRKADAPDVQAGTIRWHRRCSHHANGGSATLARDLINTPANDMGPEQLAQATHDLAKRFGANFNCIVGDDLTRQNFSAHLCGGDGVAARAAVDRFDLGDPAHPKVTLVGKGSASIPAGWI